MPVARRTLLTAGLSAGMAATFTGVTAMTAALAATSQTILAPIRPGIPTLVVRDLETVARYYEETIGLHRIDAERDSVRLGAGGQVLLVLRKRDVELEPRGFAGLFHTAFLMPTRGDLGRWLHRAIKADVMFDGASDHKVSEALYLSDPEGNGIEIYGDRPRDAWRWNGRPSDHGDGSARRARSRCCGWRDRTG